MAKVAFVSFTHTIPSSQLTGFWAEQAKIAEESGEMTYISEDFKLISAQTALREETGIQLENVGWNDPTIHWEDYSAIVIRSTWDYFRPDNYPKFLAWFDRIETLPVWNSVPMMRWNSDKHYLRELAQMGVRIPPSVWVEKGEQANIAQIMRQQGWSSAIVKPCVAGGAEGLLRYDTIEQAEAGQAEFAQAISERAMIVQQLVRQITTDGEWSYLFFMGADGKPTFSHAVQKIPQTGDIRVQGGQNIPMIPTDEHIQQAHDMILAAQSLFPTPILYARVDVVPRDGTLVLMELELIEPYFFFLEMNNPAPIERFIRALQVVLG